tara:strand:+ start:105 stop:263 length:159 start_codon:yes stop_codon:yes gene_type:complete
MLESGFSDQSIWRKPVLLFQTNIKQCSGSKFVPEIANIKESGKKLYFNRPRI